ncbi:HemN-related non-iron pseudo-SAM protein PsgB [Borreliella valaisiana]|uniref:Putative oxygen-independent coproporphyrinogen III oxidase n=1 Tax=Borreliella valaisiana VS116 TaxID=445987 RepID=D6RW08_BORVA|nr:HemN-related non-iron pseudo-SAM protein PsgB [Borreliella valaisiana]AIJ30004.1 coproporphyrinogen III oxidase [Borreliella valaisiana Tom4006]EEF81612.1 putative oxygen-independent coproporphyrinogen III oxidase [Borreliella valaisiana VS116]
MRVDLLSLIELSLYINISFCCKDFSIFNRILDKLKYHLILLGHPIIKTLYIKHVDFCLCGQDNLKFIFTSLSKYINLALLEEFTLEIIPGYVDFEKFKLLDEFFVTRINLGVQSFSLKFRKIIGIPEIPYEKMNILINNIRKFPFDLNIDMTINMPLQKKSHLKYDLKELLSYMPEHICFSDFICEKEGLTLRDFDNGIDSEKLWFCALECLESNGYINYEITNFALKGHESKHNKLNWELKPYLGLGLHAVSLLFCSDNNNIRALIRKDNGFVKSNNYLVTFKLLEDLEFFIYHFIQGLGTIQGVNLRSLRLRFEYDEKQFFQFISYCLTLSGKFVFDNNIMLLKGHERFKLDFYLVKIINYFNDNIFKVKFRLP